MLSLTCICLLVERYLVKVVTIIRQIIFFLKISMHKILEREVEKLKQVHSCCPYCILQSCQDGILCQSLVIYSISLCYFAFSNKILFLRSWLRLPSQLTKKMRILISFPENFQSKQICDVKHHFLQITVTLGTGRVS